MKDKIVTIVLWSLGSAITLVGVLLAYLQYRRSGPAATKADEERPILPITVAHDESVTHQLYVPCLTLKLPYRANSTTDARWNIQCCRVSWLMMNLFSINRMYLALRPCFRVVGGMCLFSQRSRRCGMDIHCD